VAKFDRYMLSQLLVLFGFFALVLVALFWINRAVILFDRLIGDGQSALVFLEFTMLGLPRLITTVLPIAAFAGAVYVTNRMSGESELTVMQSTGSGPWRMARPVLVYGVLVGLMMSVLSHFLVPMAQAELRQRESEVSQNVTARPARRRDLHRLRGLSGAQRRGHHADHGGRAGPTAQHGGHTAGHGQVCRFLPTIATETNSTTGDIAEEFHSRFAQALFCVIAALVGYATLMVGGFSRFGVWREIAIAFGLLIAIDGLRGALVDAVRSDAAVWPLMYLPSLIGTVLVLGLLSFASRPQFLRRWKRRAA